MTLLSLNFDREDHRDSFKLDLIDIIPEEHKHKIEDLFQFIDDTVEQCENFEEEITAANQEASDAEERASQLDDEIDTLTEKLSEAEDKIAELEQAQ